jgi:hypothetical protein
MNAQEAESGYLTIKSQLDSGQILPDEFNRKVSELRYQDNTGTWWAISPTDGSWLRWNGTVWEPASVSKTPSHDEQEHVEPVLDRNLPTQGEESHKATVSKPPEGGNLPPATKHPLSKGQMYTAGSIVCGIIAFVRAPLILGFAGILLGMLALKEKYRPGAIGILISTAVILTALLITFFPKLLP